MKIDSSTGATYLFWTEQNSGQSQSGLWGQRFDAAGNRQWGNTGTAFVPIGSPQVLQVRAQVSGGGAFVFWVRVPSFGAFAPTTSTAPITKSAERVRSSML